MEGGEGWFVIPKHPDQMHAGDVVKSFSLGEIEQLEWESSKNDTHLGVVCKIIQSLPSEHFDVVSKCDCTALHRRVTQGQRQFTSVQHYCV